MGPKFTTARPEVRRSSKWLSGLQGKLCSSDLTCLYYVRTQELFRMRILSQKATAGHARSKQGSKPRRGKSVVWEQRRWILTLSSPSLFFFFCLFLDSSPRNGATNIQLTQFRSSLKNTDPSLDSKLYRLFLST